MSAFKPEALSDKIEKLNATQQSIETVSQWCIFFRKVRVVLAWLVKSVAVATPPLSARLISTRPFLLAMRCFTIRQVHAYLQTVRYSETHLR